MSMPFAKSLKKSPRLLVSGLAGYGNSSKNTHKISIYKLQNDMMKPFLAQIIANPKIKYAV